MNENEMTTTLNFWNLLKSVLWAKVMTLIAYMKIWERASKKITKWYNKNSWDKQEQT